MKLDHTTHYFETEPELEPTEDSEIAAFVDLSTSGQDGINRPINICQDDQMVIINLADAKLLASFLIRSIKFIEQNDVKIFSKVVDNLSHAADI